MPNNEIHLYPTTSGRTIAAKQHLDITPTPEVVDMAAFSRADCNKLLCDAPTAEIATFICSALQTLQAKPKHSLRDKHAPLSEAAKKEIYDAAKQAANMHAKCLAQGQRLPVITPYRYIYTTNRKRYAISQHTLAHAAMEDPEKINEELLSKEDLAATCFVYSFFAAAAIPLAIAPTFHDANSKEVHAMCNEAVLGVDNEILVRHGTEYRSLATTIQEIAKHKVAHMLADLYIDIFKYQSALCSIYLEHTCAKSA